LKGESFHFGFLKNVFYFNLKWRKKLGAKKNWAKLLIEVNFLLPNGQKWQLWNEKGGKERGNLMRRSSSSSSSSSSAGGRKQKERQRPKRGSVDFFIHKIKEKNGR